MLNAKCKIKENFRRPLFGGNFLFLSKIFEQSEKINLSFCRRQIIIPPKVDYHSAEGGFSFALRAIKD
jgi:hypothetical protein